MSSRLRGILFSTPRTKARLRGPGFWLSAWLPVTVGIVVVVVESTPAFGADRTSHPFRWLVQLVTGPLSDATWEIVHHLIRKTGHFVGYGLLGLAWLRAWRMTLPQLTFLQQAGMALLGTGLVAAWDEWHQTFLPNRTGSPWDVLLDCCGAAVMSALAWLYLSRFRRDRAACTG